MIAEDPQTANAPSMPEAAIAASGVDLVLPFEAIAYALVSLVMVPGAKALFGLPHLAA